MTAKAAPLRRQILEAIPTRTSSRAGVDEGERSAPASLLTLRSIHHILLIGASSMNSSKYRNLSSPLNNGVTPGPRETQSCKLASFRLFPLLPAELQHLILKHACFSPSSPSKSFSTSTGRFPLHHDIAMMLSLSVVSRQIHHRVSIWLFRNIVITRPSSLHALHQALLTKPERGNMIFSLPQDILPRDWWPLRLTRHGIATSLDQWQLPAGCGSGQVWPLDGRPSDCQGRAVRNALTVAQRSLGIYLLADRSMPTHGIEDVVEVQAALDLYLIEMRRIEDKMGIGIHSQCSKDKCLHYPPLHIKTNNPFSASTAPEEAFTLYRPQLLRHLARRGAATDRFDHPVLLARSGFSVRVITPAGAQHPQHRGAMYKLRSDSWNMAKREADSQFESLLLQDEHEPMGLSGDTSSSTIAYISTLSACRIIHLARTVVNLASNIKTLSLTGFLQHALNGQQELPSLRRLSLGPQPPRWKARLPLNGLRQIEELRICGGFNAADVSFITEEMPSLKELEVGLVDQLPHSVK